MLLTQVPDGGGGRVQPQLAGRRDQQPGQDLQEGRLADPVGAHDAQAGGGPHREGHVVERLRRVEALGDGSDYTAFQDFAGISTLDLGFGDEDDGTQYHSIYDDFHWYSEFVDRDFAYGRALAQTAGTAIMRLADGSVPGVHGRVERPPQQ